MAGQKQSKRVSWAPAVKLCQVRLFLSDDTPSQSGSGAQDNLQAKAAWLWHSREAAASDGQLPPGFEPPPPIQHWPKAASIPLVKWKIPLKLSLNQGWLVVAGEESKELELQNQRQLGVFEAIYPRLSSIPPNPVSSESPDLFHYEDPPPPLIPVTAIEDDPEEEELELQAGVDVQRESEVAVDLPDLVKRQVEVTESRGSNLSNEEKSAFVLPPGVEPDVAAAAAAAFTVLMRSNEAGNLIDRDLLIKILSDPSLMEKLLSEYGPPKSQHMPLTLPVAAAVEGNPGPPMPNNLPQVRSVLSANNPMLPSQSGAVPPISGGQVARNAGYFKTLIQHHGGDGFEDMGPGLGYSSFDGRHDYIYKGFSGGDVVAEQGNLKPRIPKICAFFNSPRGCRNGASCQYIHDNSLPQRSDWVGRKKIRLDKEMIRRA